MNPWYLIYSNFEGYEQAGHPGAIVVTGRGNRMDPRFQTLREKGAKVYTYWNVLNCPDSLHNAQDAYQYLVNGTDRPPLWKPHTHPNPEFRSNWPGTKLLDIHPGSVWFNHIVAKTVEVARLGLHDGFFMDTLGQRPWAADYPNWPTTEQGEWSQCTLALAKALCEAITAVDHRIEIVHNNIWTQLKEGDKYCNGVCLENAPPGPEGQQPSPFHEAYAGRMFGRLPRRVLVVQNTDEKALAWKDVVGVTHLASVDHDGLDNIRNTADDESYQKMTPAVVPAEGWSAEEQIKFLEWRVKGLTGLLDEAEADLEEIKIYVAGLESQIKPLLENEQRLVSKINQIKDIVNG